MEVNVGEPLSFYYEYKASGNKTLLIYADDRSVIRLNITDEELINLKNHCETMLNDNSQLSS